MRIGIDIGGSHIAAGIVDKNGKILSKETRDIDINYIKDENRAENLIVDIIENEINFLLQKNDFDISDISKIGIAVPGMPKEGKIRNLVNLNIKEFNIGKVLEEKYKTTIKIKNDGKCAGLAEKKYGALRIYDDCAFLCIGTGVGSAIFLGGELLESKNSSGFELGHMIIDKNGKLCNCGQKGCFETYASMKRFKQEAINRLKLGNNKEIQAEEVQNYIRNNIEKKDVKEFIEEYLENVSIGLINIINIFEPEAICFGGSFSYYEDIFIPRLYNILKGRTFNKESKVKLLPAKLKNDAGIIGAAEL